MEISKKILYLCNTAPCGHVCLRHNPHTLHMYLPVGVEYTNVFIEIFIQVAFV